MNMKWVATSITGMALVVVAVKVAPRTVQAQQGKTVWDGVYSAGQVERGQTLYLQRCGTCHGGRLEGTEIGPSLTDDIFRTKWDGKPLGDLYDIIHATMPQDQPGVLTRQQAADTLALILSKGGFPAGQAEIPTQNAALGAITFAAKKP